MNDLNHIQQYLTDQYQMDPGPSTSSMPVPNWGSSDSGAPVTPMPPPAPGPIRRRRFSTAKIQPTRIKKVMQSDEEIGRMVASVPVAIGRAMEHFAEKFLQAAAQATHGSNSRTLTPAHMKQAMMANRHFGFLDGVLKEVGAPGLPKVEQDTTRPHQIQLPPNMIGFPGVGLAPGVSPTTSSPLSHLTPDPNLSPGGFPFPLSSPPFSALGHLFPPMGSSQMADLASSPVQSIPLSPSVQQAPSEGSKVGVANGAAQKRTNNKKEPLPNGEKPKRGRPRKIKKDEKCLDEEMFKDVSTVIEKEDKEVKDREMMPPPALPMGGFGRPKPVS